MGLQEGLPRLALALSFLVAWVAEHIARHWADPTVAVGIGILALVATLIAVVLLGTWFAWATDEDGGW